MQIHNRARQAAPLHYLPFAALSSGMKIFLTIKMPVCDALCRKLMLENTGAGKCRAMEYIGFEPGDAFQQVRKARIDAIQTSSQEDCIWRMGNRQSR